MKIEDNYHKEKSRWICLSCNCEIYSGKKKYISICSCLSRERQVDLYVTYLGNFYTINGSEYQCNKCGQKITSAREKHAISCCGRGTLRSQRNINLNPEYFSKYCDMGCGQVSNFFHKNGKCYCTKFGAKCPIKIAKDKEKKIGINPFANREHPKGMLGKAPYNKGLTKETSEKVAKNALAARKIFLLKGDQRKKKYHTQESRDKISQNMKDRYASGWETVCGRAKKYKYSSPIAGDITVDGTWELDFAKTLDIIGIEWERNKKRFKYINLENKDATYRPDFFIPSLNTYIEVKGYQTELDDCKWRQFKEQLLIVKREEIKVIRQWLKENKKFDFKELLKLISINSINFNGVIL